MLTSKRLYFEQFWWIVDSCDGLICIRTLLPTILALMYRVITLSVRVTTLNVTIRMNLALKSCDWTRILSIRLFQGYWTLRRHKNKVWLLRGGGGEPRISTSSWDVLRRLELDREGNSPTNGYRKIVSLERLKVQKILVWTYPCQPSCFCVNRFIDKIRLDWLGLRLALG